MSPFFFFLSFLRKGVLFHHDLLVPLGSGWVSGACLPSSLFFLSSGKGLCSGSSWFRLGFRCLSPFFSLLWFRCLFFLSSRKGFCSIMICCWFRLGFRCLSPFFLFFGSGACLPSSLFFLFSGKGFCSIMICWFSWFRLGFRCLSPFFCLLSFLWKAVLFHHDLLVLPGSSWGSGACLPSSPFFLSSGQGFCSIMICWFLLVPALVSLILSSLVLVLVSLLLSSFFPQDGFCSIMICWFLVVPAGVPVLVSLFLSSLVPVLVCLLLSSFFPQERGSVPS